MRSKIKKAKQGKSLLGVPPTFRTGFCILSKAVKTTPHTNIPTKSAQRKPLLTKTLGYITLTIKSLHHKWEGDDDVQMRTVIGFR